jgi:hypothetical protein
VLLGLAEAKTMTETTDLVQQLTQMRDELRLRLHLGSMEVKEQWSALEEKWEDFAARARLAETSENVEDGIRMLGDELAKGYAQVKAALR